MYNRIVTGLLGVGVALAVRPMASVGQDLHESEHALVASWSEFETAIDTRLQRLAEQWRKVRPRPNGAILKVVQSDLVRSRSIKHPVTGLVEIEAEFCEGEFVRLPNGARTLCRIVSFELYFSPRDKKWEFAHGTATLVWSADEKNEHPGTRAQVDLKSPSYRWGMDLIAQVLREGDQDDVGLSPQRTSGKSFDSPSHTALIAALHLLAANGEAEHVKTILEEYPDLVDARRQFKQPHKPLRTDSFTPLHHAVENGHEGVVTALLDRGADVNRTVGGGWTPLHLAARRGHLSVVKLLVEHGADVDAKTAAKPETFEIAPGAPADDTEPVRLPAVAAMTPLDVAKKENQIDVVAFLSSLIK